MVDIPRNKYELEKVHIGKCELGWICDTLIQTYNTSVLDLSDPTFKDACIEQAHKCVYEENVYGTYQRKVLSQLILNHSSQNDPDVTKENKKPITDFIGGPLSLTMHWSKEYKKIIYIFGESHSKMTDCHFAFGYKPEQVMLIEDYLEQLFKNTDVFIDFYLETDRTYQDIYGDTRIGVMAKRFKDCFHNPNTKENENKCKLSRMHYVDIRKEAPDIKPNRMSYACIGIFFVSEYININKTLPRLRFLLDKYNYDTQIKPILEEFSKINIYDDTEDDEKYKEYDEFWDNQIKELNFLIKKATRSTIHDKIKSFIKKEVRDLGKYSKKIDDIKILVKTVKDFITTLNKYSTGTVNQYDFDSITENDRNILLNVYFLGIFISINSNIVDYYLLCRIFKVFDFTKLKNHRWTDEPKEPHNIIIYAGDTHSKNVRNFLKELEFEEISTTSSIKSTDKWKYPNIHNCIDIQNFPQPFFSNHKKVKWSYELEKELVVDDEILDLELTGLV